MIFYVKLYRIFDLSHVMTEISHLDLHYILTSRMKTRLKPES